jgi:beta-xylosidase
VSCYSSGDFEHWVYRGIALTPTTDGSDLDTGMVIERPKVIYNSSTRQFVMWMHIDSNNYAYARAGVAVSDRPEGPYHYLGSVRPNGQMSRDMTLFRDDDGKAYLVYSSENNQTMQVCLLSPDYLHPTTDYRRILVGRNREAPAMLKNGKRYYLVTSACTGWSPNAALLATAYSPFGPWKEAGNPCAGPGSDSTFGAQSTYIVYLVRDRKYLFMADRWNKTNLPMSGYLWLPLEIEKKGIVIRNGE